MIGSDASAERDMCMRLIKVWLLTLILACCLGVAQAQEPKVTASPAAGPTPEMSAAKRALIKEMLELTNSRESSEGMFTAQFDEITKQMPDIVWQSISSMDEYKKLSPAQQQEVRTRINERSVRFAEQVKALFLARIDMKQLVEDISYAVYDKHFTEAELKDLVAFYQSDTGKKVIREMPALFAESIAKGGEIISPKVKDIIEETKRIETADLAREIVRLYQTAPKKPVKKTTRRTKG